MFVAVHNPSNVELSVAEIQVPHGHYNVSAFNSTTQKWFYPAKELISYSDKQENGIKVQENKLLVNWATKPRDISLLRLIYDPSMNIEAKQMDMKKNPTISCKEATLEFLGENSQGGISLSSLILSLE